MRRGNRTSKKRKGKRTGQMRSSPVRKVKLRIRLLAIERQKKLLAEALDYSYSMKNVDYGALLETFNMNKRLRESLFNFMR